MPKIKADWDKLKQTFSGLDVTLDHTIEVQREAIPLVFVPGIMGSRLKRKGTPAPEENGLPTIRWDPGSSVWMARKFLYRGGAHRKRMLIGPSFSPDYLEVINDDDPVDDGEGLSDYIDGFGGLFEPYVKDFLDGLRARNEATRDSEDHWGALLQLFDFPVYALGYNWTGQPEHAAEELVKRIGKIIEEAKAVTGACEKVIVITHSMGGLVTRWANKTASGKILGIIHGVQPCRGAAAAYWRMKAGFENPGGLKARLMSGTLGNCGPEVTPLLANSPGGLSLLPSAEYTTNEGNGGKQWLRITEEGQDTRWLPEKDPYSEIYEVPAVVRPVEGMAPRWNKYWGLVDPELLDPGNAATATGGEDNNSLDNDSGGSPPWSQYKRCLKLARDFQEQLAKLTPHPHTYNSRGTGHATADYIELRVESQWVFHPNYDTREFRGFFKNEDGDQMQAVLQDPKDKRGDGTVPLSSSGALNKKRGEAPGDFTAAVEHQPAYGNQEIQQYTYAAIAALCRQRMKDQGVW